MQLPISSIVEDAAYQARDAIDKAWVESLVDVFDETSSVLVYALPDGRRVLVDGFHRMAAARQLKRTEIQATVKDGTETDALDAAAEANAHATQSPLKQKERRRLVVAMAGRHPDWPHEKIARLLGMSRQAVDKILNAEDIIVQIKSNATSSIGDTTALAMAEAPPATYTPLAEAATASKWKPADTKEVAWKTAQVVTPQDDTPALPVETAAQVLHLAAEKEWTSRETQAALHVAAQSDDGYVERLASGAAIPVVPNDAGVYGALPETIERILGASQDPTPGQLLSAMVKAYGYASLHDPKDAARTLTPGTAAHYRDELPRLVAYVEKVIDALAFSRLELMS